MRGYIVFFDPAPVGAQRESRVVPDPTRDSDHGAALMQEQGREAVVRAVARCVDAVAPAVERHAGW